MPSFSPKCLPDGHRYARHAESKSKRERVSMKRKEREDMEKERMRQKGDSDMGKKKSRTQERERGLHWWLPFGNDHFFQPTPQLRHPFTMHRAQARTWCMDLSQTPNTEVCNIPQSGLSSLTHPANFSLVTVSIILNFRLLIFVLISTAYQHIPPSEIPFILRPSTSGFSCGILVLLSHQCKWEGLNSEN